MEMAYSHELVENKNRSCSVSDGTWLFVYRTHAPEEAYRSQERVLEIKLEDCLTIFAQCICVCTEH
jgi:hypothetical protein